MIKVIESKTQIYFPMIISAETQARRDARTEKVKTLSSD
jgi:hypothetical protein